MMTVALRAPPLAAAAADMTGSCGAQEGAAAATSTSFSSTGSLLVLPAPTQRARRRCSFRSSALTARFALVAAAAAASTSSVAAAAVSSADCWVGGWTPEICCSAPGAKGNPLCWDHVFTFDKCCTETEEGIQFDLRRRNFISDMVRRGATVQFDIRHVSGGRTGAVASRTLAPRSTVLRVPATQVFSLKSVPAAVAEAARRHECDAHAVLALGLAMERVNPSSMLTAWIRLLPMSFANVLWFTERQLQLVNGTFFGYIVQNWFGDLQCMQHAANEIPPGSWRGRKVDFEDLRWALSVVKTRGFAFEGTRESTMLIPLADFLNHNRVASVRTATLAEDALRFVATQNVMPGEELCIDYAQASNLEFLVRYGFHVDDNPYGGRQFDLGGEPLQAHCPSYILRYDISDIIENTTVDCHRQARYLSFEQQFGPLQPHEQLREDRYIYHAVEQACEQLLSMMEEPSPFAEQEANLHIAPDGRAGSSDAITAVLLKAIRAERVLLQRCITEFQRRQLELEPRHLPATLAEPLARLRGPVGAAAGAGGESAGMQEPAGAAGMYDAAGGFPAAGGAAAAYGGQAYGASGGAAGTGFSMPRAGPSSPADVPPNAGYGGPAAAAGGGLYGASGGYGGASAYGQNAYGGAGAAGVYGGGAASGGAYGGTVGYGSGNSGAAGYGGYGGGNNAPPSSPSGYGYGAYGQPAAAGGAASGLGMHGLGLGGAPGAAGGASVGGVSSAPAAAAGGGGGGDGTFSSSVDRSRVDQLLQRLQQGTPLG